MRRLKRRYLLLQLDTESPPPERDLLEALWAATVRLYGEVGASLTSLALISYDCERKFAVVRASLDAVDGVRTAVAVITSLSGKPAAVHVLAVSGTIKALRKSMRA